jgi:toxin ParE1/3/4
MKYRLSDLARQDLREIRAHISADNPAAAKQVIRKIQETFEFLVRHPRVGSTHQDLADGLRSFPAQQPAHRYVIFFQAHGEVLLIARVIHGARDFPALFK